MGIVVRLLLLCRLRHRNCHLLVVVAVAAVVVIFVIVIVVMANVVAVVVAIVVLRVWVEHAVEGRVAGVVELDGVLSSPCCRCHCHRCRHLCYCHRCCCQCRYHCFCHCCPQGPGRTCR